VSKIPPYDVQPRAPRLDRRRLALELLGVLNG